MPLISYAQNGEDIVLWRALCHIEEGFYVDIGACDPIDLSVTKLFYDKGWHGINVEPSKAYFERCVTERPRDLNLNVAITTHAGVIRFLDIAGTGLSTTIQENAKNAVLKGFEVAESIVPALSLSEVLLQSDGKDIHFLKIDVEGSEKAVLEGGDFARFRPWIVVVEATMPNSTTRTDEAWRDLLLNYSYEEAYFDGVNLYFVAEEHRDLMERLAIPPNALDEYQPLALVKASQRIEELASMIASLENALSEARTHGTSTEEALAWMRETQGRLETQIAELGQASEGEAAARTRLQTELIEARTHGASAEDALAWMRETQERLEARIVELEQVSKDEAATRTLLQAELAEARTREASVENALTRMSETQALLETQVAELKQASEIGNAARISLEAALSDERAQLNREQRSRRTLYARLAQERSVAEEERGIKERIQSQLDQMILRWDEVEKLVADAVGLTFRPDASIGDRISADWQRRDQEVQALREVLSRQQEWQKQMLSSTSWRMTAPLRGVRRVFQSKENQPATREVVGKNFARKAFRLSVRAIFQIPGTRRGVRLAYRIIPNPLDWLALRYRFYEGHIVHPAVPVLQPIQAALSPTPSPDIIAEPPPTTEPTTEPTMPPSLSPVEGRLYRQFLTVGPSLYKNR